MSKRKPTMDEVIQLYRAARDKLDRADKAHKERTQPLKDKMVAMENFMLAHFKAEGGESFKGKHGTAFTKRRRSLKVNDWDTFLKYVQDNDAYVMLNKSPNKTTVVEQLEKTGEVPPGLEVSTELVIQVNKPTGVK